MVRFDTCADEDTSISSIASLYSKFLDVVIDESIVKYDQPRPSEGEASIAAATLVLALVQSRN